MPQSAIKAYRNATEWKDFDETIGFDPAEIHPASTLSAAKGDSWYTLQGVRLEGEPHQKGIYLHGGKKVMVR